MEQLRITHVFFGGGVFMLPYKLSFERYQENNIELL